MSLVPQSVSFAAAFAHVFGSERISTASPAHIPIAIFMIANSEAALEAAEQSKSARRPVRRAANGAMGILLELRT